MRANSIGVIVIALVVLAVFAAYGSLFTVYQTKQALVVRLGEPVRVIVQRTGTTSLGSPRRTTVDARKPTRE
jgi:regulator of protease activity HflC (stomatin/prohibitin superfamily)